MPTTKEALRLAKKAGVTLLADDLGNHKFFHDGFYPTIPEAEDRIHLHYNFATVQMRIDWSAWRQSGHYYNKYYYAELDKILHVFTTLTALCQWMQEEMDKQAEEEPPEVADFARRSEEATECYLENGHRSDNQVAIDERHTDKVKKNVLKREACLLMGGWLRANLEGGCLSAYQDRNGLSDEDIKFMTDYIFNEIAKFEGRGTPPSECNNQHADYEPDIPLYLEYQNLYGGE